MKKRISLTVVMLILFLTVFTACSDSNESGMSIDNSANQPNDDMDLGYGEEEVGSEDEVISRNDLTGNVEERKVIYTGEVSLEVKDFHKTEALIEGKINKLNGYIVDSSFHDYQGREIYGKITARIPKEKFHSFLEELESDEIKVLYKDISGNDVTEEYVDLQSRLRSKEAVEKRLLSFLDEAATTEELLAVSKDLSQVQEEIEQLLGRIHYLNNQVDYSTIHIHIEEKNTVPTLKDGQPLNTWENAKNLFIETINFILASLSKAAVLIIGLSPILIPIVILLLAIFFINKRRKGSSYKD